MFPIHDKGRLVGHWTPLDRELFVVEWRMIGDTIGEIADRDTREALHVIARYHLMHVHHDFDAEEFAHRCGDARRVSAAHRRREQRSPTTKSSP